ncbi:carboxypeptidase-like regulatory domain-containing protein [Draconibacterium mangrovi]|uniref:carboxypeptidase-like regulatory domain-containing protein n=1 Tax=Draconibacterium mangrovi TaxID=2697469 RepID=UPI0013D05E05|nr:carboxypeptidase-like regulatory domain-containing protein [Draconibacterium mangrovi]
MEDFILYIGKAALALGAFYLAYLALFQHQKHFLFNRIFLPVSFLVSFLIPLITFTKVNYIQPIPAAASTGFAFLPEAAVATEPQFTFEWYHYLLAIYALGIFVFLLNLLIGHLKAMNIIRFCRLKELFGAQVNLTQKDVHPFSFFSRIVLSEKTLKNPDLKMIVDHEMIHVREHHTLDILFAELLFLFQWFNPFAWLTRDAMRNNLEYLTDHQVAQNHNAEAYQLAMVGLAHKKGVAPFLTALNGSQLKNRIIMMKKKTENRYSLLKQLVVLPLLAILVMGLSNKEVRTEVLHDAGELKVVVDGVELPADHPDLIKLDFANGFDGGEVINALGLEDKVVANALSFDINPKEDGVYYIQTSDYVPGTNTDFEQAVNGTLTSELTVKGKITNDKGEPIPAVAVLIEGTTTGTISDFSGNYVINVANEDAVLVFNMLGYEFRKVPANSEEINVVLTKSDIESKQSPYGIVVAAEHTVSGKITNENGDGLPAAAVLVKGSTVGTISDFSGNYKIETDKNSTLVFMMIGYAQKEVAIDGKSELDVQLKADGSGKPETAEVMAVKTKANMVKGKVTDENGKPLAGTAVLMKGTSIGTITDINGNYVLQSDDKFGELVFMMLGFDKKETAVNGKTQLDVKLKADSSGKTDEVKVIGYGKQQTKNEPLESVRVHIAGNSEDPLYIVDGKPVAEIKSIDPNEIESVSVLKGIQATALYGSVGGKNGVVIVTTKEAAKAMMDDAVILVEGIPYDGDINDIDPKTIESMEVLKDESATKIYGPIAKNGAISIKLKGSADLGGKSPLIFLDGEKYSGDMDDIDPKSIQSIDVLKDASAVGIYGAEAKDGVILISTRPEEITSDLELRKFIAKRMKYPAELREANITGESKMYVKVNKQGAVVSVKETGSKNAIQVDEVVAIGYKPKEVSGTTVEDAQEKLDRAAKTLLLQLPTVNIPEYKGETLLFTLKYVLQEK